MTNNIKETHSVGNFMQKIIKSSLTIFSTLAIFALFFYGMDYDKYLPAVEDSQVTSISIISEADTHSSSIFKQPKDIPTPPVTPVTSIDWSRVNIDKVEVYKSKRRMDLLENGKVIRSYPIRLGFTPKGHKTTEGDGKTPEGKYTLDWRNPNSQFYKSLHISYPNKADTSQAQARGVSAGGDIMIHGTAKKTTGSEGQPFYNYLPKGDWTFGCVSVTNKNMDEIWNNVKNGTPIEIFP